MRYIVAKHGLFVLGKRVLISPMSVTGTIRGGQAISVGLTRKQIRNAPSADLAQPISRKQEAMYLSYYRVPFYWGGAGLWGGALTPLEAGALSTTTATDGASHPEADPESDDESHLRSTREVVGYRVREPGEEVGTVTDFLIEDTTWAVRYLCIETAEDIGGGTLFISPHWVQEISWLERRVSIEILRAQLARVPKVGVGGVLSRDDEERLHEFFGKARYWR